MRWFKRGEGEDGGHRARWRTGVIPGSLGERSSRRKAVTCRQGTVWLERPQRTYGRPLPSLLSLRSVTVPRGSQSGWRRWDPSLPQPRERDGVTRRKGREGGAQARGAGGGERRPGFALSSVCKVDIYP